MAEKKSLIAVTVGSQNVSAAVFGQTGGGGLQLRNHHSEETPGEEVPQAAVQAAVTNVASKLNIKGSSVRYSITSHPKELQTL